jgi:hypothetical protein
VEYPPIGEIDERVDLATHNHRIVICHQVAETGDARTICDPSTGGDEV